MAPSKAFNALFKTTVATVENPQTILIEDGLGTSLELPMIHSFSYRQQALWSSVFTNMDTGESATDTHARAAATMLKNLLGDEKISLDDLLKDPNGNDLSALMVKALYEYFDKVANNHMPQSQMMCVMCAGAKKLAISFAREHNGVAAIRSDHRAKELYYVFNSVKEVMAMNAAFQQDDLTSESLGTLVQGLRWEIVANHAVSEETEAVTPAKKN